MFPLSREVLIGLLVGLGGVLLFILVLIFRKQRELKSIRSEDASPHAARPAPEDKDKERMKEEGKKAKEDEKRRKEEEKTKREEEKARMKEEKRKQKEAEKLRKQEEKAKREEEKKGPAEEAEPPVHETGPTDVRSIKSRILSSFHGHSSKPPGEPKVGSSKEEPEPPAEPSVTGPSVEDIAKQVATGAGKPAKEKAVEGQPPAPQPPEKEPEKEEKPVPEPEPLAEEPEPAPAPPRKPAKPPKPVVSKKPADESIIEGYEVGEDGMLESYPEARREPEPPPKPEPAAKPAPVDEKDDEVEYVDLGEPEEPAAKPPAAAPEPPAKEEPAPEPAPSAGPPKPMPSGKATEVNAAQVSESPQSFSDRVISIKGTVSLSSKGDNDAWYVLFDESGSVVVRSSKEIPFERVRIAATVSKTRLGQTYLDVRTFEKL
jgi:hypothetical protein